MKETTINFEHTHEDITAMAIFIARLIREGVSFRVKRDPFGAEVTLTGLA